MIIRNNGTVLLIAVFVVAMLSASEETNGLIPKDAGKPITRN